MVMSMLATHDDTSLNRLLLTQNSIPRIVQIGAVRLAIIKTDMVGACKTPQKNMAADIK